MFVRRLPLENLLRRLLLSPLQRKPSNIQTVTGLVRAVTVQPSSEGHNSIKDVVIRGADGEEITINEPTIVAGSIAPYVSHYRPLTIFSRLYWR